MKDLGAIYNGQANYDLQNLEMFGITIKRADTFIVHYSKYLCIIIIIGVMESHLMILILI